MKKYKYEIKGCKALICDVTFGGRFYCFVTICDKEVGRYQKILNFT